MLKGRVKPSPPTKAPCSSWSCALVCGVPGIARQRQRVGEVPRAEQGEAATGKCPTPHALCPRPGEGSSTHHPSDFNFNHCVSLVVVQKGDAEDGVEEGKAPGVEVNKYVEALQLLFREGYVPTYSSLQP